MTGCPLVINNYIGDRLNFGLAAERAEREGYDVRRVIVADDILCRPMSARGSGKLWPADGRLIADRSGFVL